MTYRTGEERASRELHHRMHPRPQPRVPLGRQFSSCSSCRCRGCSGSRAPVAQPQLRSARLCRSFRLVIFVSFFVCSEASKSPYSFRTMVQSQALQSLTIGKLAAAGGVGVETVRYYQRRGLLGTPPRHEGIRRYGSDDLRRLRFIRQAQAAGFTLEEIRELLDLDASDDRARARDLANERCAKRWRRKSSSSSRPGCARSGSRASAGAASPGPCPILTSFDV